MADSRSHVGDAIREMTREVGQQRQFLRRRLACILDEHAHGAEGRPSAGERQEDRTPKLQFVVERAADGDGRAVGRHFGLQLPGLDGLPGARCHGALDPLGRRRLYGASTDAPRGLVHTSGTIQ